MRLFAAVIPPEAAIAELAGAVRGLRDDHLRWTAEAGWHFTLAFMGEVHDEVLPELHARLARAAARSAPFPLRIHGSGHFGHRSLWAGAAGDLDSLRMLAERADAAARRSGVPMEQHHRYTPTSPSAGSATSGTTSAPTPRPWPPSRAPAGRSASSAWSAAICPTPGSRANGPATRSSGPGNWASPPLRPKGGPGRVRLDGWIPRPETASWPVCSY